MRLTKQAALVKRLKRRRALRPPPCRALNGAAGRVALMARGLRFDAVPWRAPYGTPCGRSLS